MTPNQILEELRKINETLEEVNRELKTTDILGRSAWRQDIKKEVEILIERKSHLVGSSGRRCPHCNGSGRA